MATDNYVASLSPSYAQDSRRFGLPYPSADSRGNMRGIKRTYRAATTTAFAAAAGTAPFFLFYGSTTGTLTVRLQRLVVSGPTLTAVAYQSINLVKYSSVATGGTAVALTGVPLDSSDGSPTVSLCSVYTAAPTAGTLVGTLASRRTLCQATTAAAAGVFDVPIEYDGRVLGEIDSLPLRSSSEGIGLLFPAAPATAITLALDIEWTEEG